MPDGTERRAAPRYPLIFAADVTEVSSGAKLSARTGDVSRTGCYIDTLNPTPPGTAILVRLTHNEEVFETSGRVIYNTPGLGMGVAFVNVPPEQQARLDRWIAEGTAQSWVVGYFEMNPGCTERRSRGIIATCQSGLSRLGGQGMSTNWRTSWSVPRRKRYSPRPKLKFLHSWLSLDVRAARSVANDASTPFPLKSESGLPEKLLAHAGTRPRSRFGGILRRQDEMASPTKTIKDFEKIVTALEKRRKSRIFCVVHTGPPQHICGPEYYKLRESRDHFSGVDTLEVLIHSPGGHAHQAYRLARYFRTHCKKLNAIIPIYAKSAATILCLNADAVFMGELAELGPIDAQMREEMEKGQEYFSPLDEFKSLEFLREYASDILDYLSFVLEHRGMSVKQALHESISGTVGIMNPLYSHIDPSRLGSYRRVLAESEDYAKRLLRFKLDEDEAAELARHLVWDYPVHDFVIDRREARNIGLPVQKLPISEERKLIGVLEALEEHEIPYVGFVKHEAQRQPRRVRAKHKAAQKLPTAVKPAARTAVAS